MANIHPFKALYYNPAKVRNLDRVIVPPYDVISESEKKMFLKMSRFNYAHIILGKDRRLGYQGVARLFDQWQRAKVLIEDTRDFFYVWEQAFLKGSKRVRRRGIVAAVALADFKKAKILPHEKTFSAPKADRLKLLKACRANLSPVFMMCQDGDAELKKRIRDHCRTPLMRFKDTGGVLSRIWRIEDAGLARQIQKRFQRKTFYIVDGHHRFATALKFSGQQGKRIKGAQSVLSVIVDMQDPSIVVYPIFRILKRVKDFHKERYLKSLEPYFIIQKKIKETRLGRHQWGIWFRKDPHFYEVTLKSGSEKSVNKKMKGHAAVKQLDVAILQQIVIPKKFHIDIRYVRGVGPRLKEVLQKLWRGDYEAVWAVNAPTVKQLKRVADARQIMPAKSTFFYPKVLSGALIRRF